MPAERMQKRVLLLCLSIMLISIAIPPVTSDSSPAIQISAPSCSLPGQIPLSTNTAYAKVNVTTAYPISNALFYYEFVPQNHSAPPPVLNISQYHTSATSVPASTGTFPLSFPIQGPENNTIAFGFVRVNDTHGDAAYSNGQPYPYPSCYFSSAAQNASLSMDLSVVDVNPRYLNMTLDVYATVINSETFSPVTLTNFYAPSFLFLNQSLSNGYYIYGSAHTTQSIYSYGIAQLYPVDSYTYVMQFQSEQLLNYSTMTLNGIQLKPNQDTPNVMNYSRSASVAQTIDNNAWSLGSAAQFSPRVGNEPASLTITLQVTRNTSEVEYPVLVPLLALYALLGASLLATRKNDLANRLLVYISIFIFSYQFLNYVNSLIVSPVAAGSNIFELLTLALIPCTAILAAFSFVRWVPWVREHRNMADAADVVGLGLATAVLWTIAQFTTMRGSYTSGVFHLVPFTYYLTDLGWFGKALLLLFAIGVSYPVARIVLRVDSVQKYFLRRRLRQDGLRQKPV